MVWKTERVHDTYAGVDGAVPVVPQVCHTSKVWHTFLVIGIYFLKIKFTFVLQYLI